MCFKFTFFGASRPRSGSSLLFKMAQPLEMTMRPPPTCTTGMEIPKKSRMCVPTRNEATKRTKLFIATWRARILRAEAGYSRVKARNTGLPPTGLTIGNSALRISKMCLATSSKGLLRKGEYSRGASGSDEKLPQQVRTRRGKNPVHDIVVVEGRDAPETHSTKAAILAHARWAE